MIEDEEDDRMFIEKHGGKIGFLVFLLVGGVAAYWFMNRAPEKPKPRPSTMVNISPVMPPPPPPPSNPA